MDAAMQVETVRTHSQAGLVSLLIALLFPLLMWSLFFILLVLQVRIENEAFTYFLMILGGSISGIVAHLTGLVFGIAGARNRARKKLLSVLGIVFNSIPLVFAAIVGVIIVAFMIHPFPLGPK
jgi:hypothetical protein